MRDRKRGINKISQAEKDIQNTIIDYLEHTGWLCCRFDNKGAYDRDTDTFYNVKRKGVSDLLNLKNGVYLAVEVKIPKEKAFIDKMIKRGLAYIPKNDKEQHIYNQLFFIIDVRDHGGVAFFCYSLDDLIQKMKENGI